MNPILIEVGVIPGALAVLPAPDDPDVVGLAAPAAELVGEPAELVVGVVLLDELLHAASAVAAPRTATAIRMLPFTNSPLYVFCAENILELSGPVIARRHQSGRDGYILVQSGQVTASGSRRVSIS